MNTKTTSWLCLMVFCFFFFQAKAQLTLNYARSIGVATSHSVGNGVATDAAGNTFVTGAFRGTNVEFNPGGTSQLLSSNGGTNADFFLAKYNSSGLIVSAADLYKRGTTNDLDKANKVYVDATGNVYIVGLFFGTIQFGSGFTGNLSGGSGKAFVAKYDNNLGFQWAIAIGDGTTNTEAKDISVDASGNVYVTGVFSGSSIDFNVGGGGFPGPGADPGPYTPITKTSNGAGDIFVAKYNSGGLCQWVSTAGGNSSSSDIGFAVDYDASGNVYVTGTFAGQNIDFGSGVILSETGGGTTSGDIFVAKYSSVGTLAAAFNMGNALAENSNGIAVEKATGDFIVTGAFSQDALMIDFDPSGASATANSVGMKDMFVAKYSSSLAYQWHKTVGSTSNDIGYSVKIASSKVFVAGSYSGTSTNFGDAKTITSAGGLDAFIAVYSYTTGACTNAYTIGGTSDEEALDINLNNGIKVTGYNAGNGDYDPGAGTTTLTNVGGSGNDIFIASYTDASCTLPTITANPVAVTRCEGTSASFSVTATGPGPITYLWQKNGTDLPTETGSTYTISTVALTDATNYTVKVTNSCGTVTSTAVALTVDALIVSNAGSAQDVCATTATLAGNAATPGTGAWTLVSGTGTVTTPSSATSGITGLTSGSSSVFKWTITNGTCSSNSNVTITSSAPVTAVAGSAQDVCATTATLAATNPSVGTGAWTLVSGTGTITTPSSFNSGVTGLTSGASSVFKWTVTNGSCTANSNVTITSSAPVTAVAGSAQDVCATTATLAATNPSVGTGAWTLVSGTGTITTPSSFNSGVTGLTSGASSVFKWTVTNGSCTANSNVTITSSAPVTAVAGSAQDVCATTATLAATNPSVGTGAWTLVSGTGTITTPSSFNSGVTGLTSGASSVFKWTVTNGSCTANSNVTITSSAPVTAVAGSAQDVCATTATLAATNPSVGTGAWTLVSGTGTITTPSAFNSGVTGLTTGSSSVFKWTVTNGSCTANSNVTITSSAPVTAVAGTAQNLCNVSTTTLAATNPSVGTGAWTLVSGTGTITTPSAFNSGVTGLTSGSSSVFKWTVTNGSCSSNADVTVTVSAPVTAVAGSAQDVCATTATLAATNPSVGTGAWTLVSGTGTITSPTVFNSGVTGLTSGASSVFKWTVTNGACTANSNVTITSSAPVTAVAGSAQDVCATTATLAATNPSIGTGAWTLVSGTGTITTPSAFNSGVTGLTSGASSVFKWTVTNGSCTDNANVTITSSAPVTAVAGTAQSLCNVSTTTLGATNPSVGTGAWTLVSGTGTITSPTAFNSGVTGLTIGTSSVFKWTVTNGSCSSNADVTVTVSAPGTPDAGLDQTICNSTTATLSAGGTGAWTKISGSGTITSPSSATSGVTGLTVGATSVFEWTVTNGACSGSDQVSIIVSSPVTAVAGSAQDVCATTATLAATNPSVGTGAWTLVSGTGTITSPTVFNSGVTGLTSGASSVFKWTVTNGACTANSNVTINSIIPVSFTTHPVSQSMCTGSPISFTAAVTGGSPITYQWKKGVGNVSNGGTVSGATSLNLAISSLVVGDAGDYTLVATNTCGSVTSNIATLTVSSSVLSITTQPVSQALCSGSNVGFDVIATGTGTLTYQWKKGVSDLSDIGSVSGSSTPSLSISSISPSDADDYTVSVTNSCGTITSNVATLTIDAPVIITQPLDQSACPGTSASFTVVAMGPSVTYQWQKMSADIPSEQAATLTLNNVSSLDESTYQCNVTACSNTITSNAVTLTLNICTGTYDAITSEAIAIYPNPTRDQVHVKMRDNDIIHVITIVNAAGDVVYSDNNVSTSSLDISVSHLSQGLYHVIIDSEYGRRIEKLEILN